MQIDFWPQFHLSEYRGESSSSQFRVDLSSVHRVASVSGMGLPLRINIYPNSSWCWVGTEPIQMSKIAPYYTVSEIYFYGAVCYND